MIGDRKKMPRFRSDFYRVSYHKIIWWLMFNVVIILGLSLAIVYYVFNQPQTSYYASTTEGQVITMPLSNGSP